MCVSAIFYMDLFFHENNIIKNKYLQWFCP